MSGIFGIFHRDGKPVAPEEIQRMHNAMAFWGPDDSGTWHNGCAGMGQCLLHNTPEAIYENLPRWFPEYNLAFTAEARVDNRDELCALFNIPYADRPRIPDSDLILLAYRRWGENCPDHILGDWSFAGWHPNEQRLFLARDHHGNTALYTFHSENTFAFASCKQALLSLPQVSQTLNDLRLAQILTSWPGDGLQTVYTDIERIPPSHTLSVTSEKVVKRRYWYLENTPLIHRKSIEDYVEEFLDIYTEAVRCRLRSLRPVGVTLSGGLDSGSVTALAARELRKDNKVLSAFTSVPIYDVSETVGKRGFGDEFPFAEATAQYVGNVELTKIAAKGVSPIEGIKRSLRIHQSPITAAANAFWLVDIMQSTRDAGIGTLLTGQSGNTTVSWTGSANTRSLWLMLKHGQISRLIRQKLLKPVIPASIWRRYKVWQKSGTLRIPDQPFLTYSAINSQFARNLHLNKLMKVDKHDPLFIDDIQHTAQQRFNLISPSRNVVGSIWAELGASFNVEVCDPTFDKRIITYCLSIPNQFYTSDDGNTKRLIRRSMVGLLPKKVLFNQKRGYQAADVGHRILKHSDELYATLAALSENERATSILDLTKMENVFHTLENEVNWESSLESRTILLRGLMVGLFLLQNPSHN